MIRFLFVLSPPYSGSTVLWKLLKSSPAISALPKEGQFMDSVKDIMRDNSYASDKDMPLTFIRQAWRFLGS